MNKKVLKTLEYDKVIRQLEGYASSDMAKALVKALEPSSDYDEILSRQDETRSALTRIFKKGNISFSGLPDIRPHLKLLEIESSLSAKELLDISRLLALCAQVKEYGSTEDEDLAFDCLSSDFDMLDPLDFLKSRISLCIVSEDEINDEASHALKDIRRQIRQTNIAIHNKLTSIVNSQSNKALLQDAIITTRNGRYCVPVKAEHRNVFPGMIHDQSSSGSTLFIEPMAVVNMNNQLKELEIKELAEIDRILKTLSAQAGTCTRELAENQRILTRLDFIFAKARYARDYQGTEPIFNKEGIIDLKQARHPLLDPSKVVPINIYLGDEFTMLLLTGPNTGGKTVSLKTVGLFSLMGQAGLHIPAFENSRLAVFSDIYADIGDEQSIEMNLSTFSSHMTNIIDIVRHVTPDCLVLFDELCGGTDPTEGAALARAILSDLHDAGIRTLATTHYAELKMFAMETEGVENGCCEFDLETLTPTYRLLIGIPGKSNAFSISRKLGLPDYIIDNAHSLMDSSVIDFESMLHKLENEKAEIAKEQTAILEERKKLEQMRRQINDRTDDIQKKREDMLREAREEAYHILSEAKEVADESIRKYNAWKQHPGQDNTKKMEARRRNLGGRVKSLEKKLAYKGKEARTISSPQDFKPGDPVFVTTLSLNGTVKSPANKNGDILVQMGFLTSTVNYKDLELLEKPKKQEKSNRSMDRYSINKAATISPEINLLGATVDEAVVRLEKYLDDAMIAGLESVRIVHGKGTGALRKGIHEYLRRQKYVKSYELAQFGEGDAGVTVVTFR